MNSCGKRRPKPQLWQLVGPELRTRPGPLLALSALAGLANTAVLGLLGTAGQGTDRQLLHLVLLLAAVMVFAGCQISVARKVAIEVENVVSRLRLDVLERIVRTDLASYERLSRAGLVSTLAGDVQAISSAAMPVLNAAQAALQLAFAVLYLFLISTTAFLLGVAGATLGSLAYLRRLRVMAAPLAEAARQDEEALETLEDALLGAVQLKQKSTRSAGFRSHLNALSARAAATGRQAREGIGGATILGQTLFFLLLGAMLWVLPAWGLAGPTVAKATMVLLFVLGAIGNLLQGVMTSATAEAAAARITALKRELTSLAAEPESAARPSPTFGQLTLRSVVYQHRAPDGSPAFGIGPLDFDLRRGELAFLSGGNGAGKTTLIKTLAGLYRPQGGSIFLNGEDLRSASASLRDTLAVVFSDFHLSRRVWGLTPGQNSRAHALLQALELGGKVAVRDGVFSTTELSTGQRKRLALIVALLESRPVLVLDEFAADQDPEFRRRFYREILPEMQSQGMTVLAVTHDSDYFAAADRRVVMEEGQLRNV